MTSNKPALFLLLGAMLVAAAHAEQPVRQHAVHPPDHLHLSPVLTTVRSRSLPVYLGSGGGAGHRHCFGKLAGCR